VRLLPIATPDPVGGPPWGMRVLSTTRRQGCIQVGRLLNGKIGAIGQDSAFGDDGLFHELPVNNAFDTRGCTVLDGNGRIFLNVANGDRPASAWVGLRGCLSPTAGRAERGPELGRPPKLCPQGDERNLYYGLLGPYAQSITYTLDGRRRTQATVGPEGAYLIVTKASPTQLFNFGFGNAGTTDVVPVDGPITDVHYRNGATCHLTARSWIGGQSSCTPALQVPVGWVAPSQPPLTASQVAAPLRVRLLRARDGGHKIVVSFTSRVAITSSRTQYQLKWHEPGMPRQVNGYQSTRFNIAAGQTVTEGIGGPGSPLRPGITRGTVSLLQATGPGQLEEGPGTAELLVGEFAVRIR
jgi:hypothetical protein